MMFTSLAICVALTAAPGVLDARITAGPGGPQLTLNGQPVPPRMFWGQQTGGTLPVTGTWTEVGYDVTPRTALTGQPTLHFRFGKVPGTIELRDVRVRDQATGADLLPVGTVATATAFQQSWRSWPEGAANTVGRWDHADGALRVTLAAPANGAWPDFHFFSTARMDLRAGGKYRVTVLVRGTPNRTLSSTLYDQSHGSYRPLGGPDGTFFKQVRLAAEAGVNIVSFSAPNCWLSPDVPENWEPLDDLCSQILEQNPQALLLPRLGLNAPAWWLKEHPDEAMVYEDGPRPSHASPSSRAYRAAGTAYLERVCRHLAAAFPGNLLGVHPCGQNTGEWFYQDSWMRPLSGYDRASREAFREWVKAAGDADWAAAEVPDAASRHAAPHGFLRDPAKERRLIQFARFQQEEMADLILSFAAGSRRGLGAGRLVVFFYGYLFEFGALSNGAPTSGHYALSRVLPSPDIDILCSPISYWDRAWLGTGPCMTAAESVTAAGKLWLNEDDTRTFLDPRQQERVQEGGLVDLPQTQSLMLRNTAQEALRGFGSWWMDLPGQGWFNDSRIWDVMEQLRPVEEAMCRRAQPFTPDVAAIVDEVSMCHLPGGSAGLSRPLTYEIRADFGRLGAPYGQYLLDHVASGQVKAKLQVFLAAWHLTPAQKSALAANRPAGVTRVWCYAPGYLQADRADVAAMTEVTGFRHRAVTLDTAEAQPTAAGRALGITTAWGPKTKIAPLFAVEAPAADVLATWSDGSPAMAIRRGPQGIDVFCGVPALTPEVLRALAKVAGAHLYTDQPAAVWEADGYLSLAPLADGTLRIDAGGRQPVTDALTGQPLSDRAVFDLPVKAGVTRVLKLGR